MHVYFTYDTHTQSYTSTHLADPIDETFGPTALGLANNDGGFEESRLFSGPSKAGTPSRGYGAGRQRCFGNL